MIRKVTAPFRLMTLLVAFVMFTNSVCSGQNAEDDTFVLVPYSLDGVSTELSGVAYGLIGTVSAEAIALIIQGIFSARFYAAVKAVKVAHQQYINLFFNAIPGWDVPAAAESAARAAAHTANIAQATAGVVVVFVGLAVIGMLIAFTVEIIKSYPEYSAPYDVSTPLRAIYRDHSLDRFGLYFDEHATETHNIWSPRGHPHYYSIQHSGNKKKFDAAGYRNFMNDKETFNNTFFIYEEAFRKTTGIKNNFVVPPHLNYIGDDAFRDSDLESIDFTRDSAVAVIGAGAFQNTRVPVIDLSRHFALGSLGMACFADNPNLHTLKLPGTIAGIGAFFLKNTPKLETVEVGWDSGRQTEAIKDNLPAFSNIFEGKKLLIPFGSFDQYYRWYGATRKFLGGDFLLAENLPYIWVVGAEREGGPQIKSGSNVVSDDFVYRLTTDMTRQPLIESIANIDVTGKHFGPGDYDAIDKDYPVMGGEILTKGDKKRLKAQWDVINGIKTEEAIAYEKDKDSNILYALHLLTKQAGIIPNEFIKKSGTLIIRSNKIRYSNPAVDEGEFTIDFSSISASPKEYKPENVAVEMEHVPDGMLSTVTGHPAFTFTDKVKTIGRGVVTAPEDVYFDWRIKIDSVNDRAFGENTRIHVINYDGKREDFTYFDFHFTRIGGGKIMPLPGMTEEELRRKTVDGVTYEYVNDKKCRVFKIVGEHVALLPEKEISGSVYSAPVEPAELPGLFKGNKVVETVRLGDHIKALPDGAFKACPFLESIELSNSVERIGKECFSGDGSLITLPLPADGRVENLPEKAFYGCTALRNFTLPASVQSVGEKSFSGCISLKEVTLTPAVRSIGKGAFEGCTRLAALWLPSLPSVTVGAGAFAGVSPSFTTHIPKGSEVHYGYAGDGSASDYWQGFPIAPNYYAVTADGNYWKEGNVSGNSRERDFAYGTDRFLEAVPAEGYRFVKWTNAAGDSLSAGNPHTLTVRGDTTIWAHFTKGLYRVYLSAAENGRIRGGGGDYVHNAQVQIEAEADAGYHFVKWTNVAGDSVFSRNPHTVAVKSDLSLQAHFAGNPYQVHLSAVGYGRIKSGEGKRAYHTQARVEAEADEGFYFVKWTNAAGDSLSAQNPYTFRVEGETEMQAHFARSLYRVSLSAAGHGEVSSEGGVYPYYAEVEAEAFPDAGYYFTKWTDEAGKLVSSMNPYTFAAKSSMALRAHFVANPYQVSLSAENGRIKSGDGAYSRGATVKIEAEGDAGYHFEKWTDGEGNSVSAANPYTFALKGWTELTAVFAKENLTETATGFEPLTGFETLLGVNVYYTEGVLHLVNLEGYSISVSTMKGERVLLFTAGGDHAEYAAALPAGVYILNGAKGKEKAVVRKFMVK
ncbi:Listeria-Bacteroides repeat domain [Bacteroidales bacterium Barb4]|nr:Listeria-Bacteroides repeat domain [Bacteroidales bacterium Barb4]